VQGNHFYSKSFSEEELPIKIQTGKTKETKKLFQSFVGNIFPVVHIFKVDILNCFVGDILCQR
jgi:hypothetical protein